MSKNWFRTLFRRPRLERDLDDELRFHLEKQIEQNLAAGMTPQEARYAALRAFGGVAQVKEECRDLRPARWLSSLLQDLHYGLRMLRRNPGVTTAAVISLALGIGANTAIFSVVNAVLLRPLPYRDPDRLTWAVTTLPDRDWFAVSDPDFLDWRAQTRLFEDIAAYRTRGAVLTSAETTEQLPAWSITPNFLSLLGLQPAAGRNFLSEETQAGQEGVVILSHGFWQNRFGGDLAVVGGTLTLDGRPHSIVGVMPRGLEFLSGGGQAPQLFRPLVLMSTFNQRRRDLYAIFPLARVKPDVSFRQAQDELDALERRLSREYPGGDGKPRNCGARLYPLFAKGVERYRTILLALLGAVAFVLLIACGNVANLLLARAAGRQREMAIRGAVGATRTRLLRQLLTESVLLAALGGAGGLLLGGWAVRFLAARAPVPIPRLPEAGLNSRVLLVTLLVSLLAGLLFGLAPALRASRAAGWLRASVAPRLRVSTSQALVAGQVALTFVLLVGAGLMIRTVARLSYQDLGFQPDRLLTAFVNLPRTRYAEPIGVSPDRDELLRDTPRVEVFARGVLDRLRALPGVEAAGATEYPPLQSDQYPNFPCTVVGSQPPPGGPPPWLIVRGAIPEFFEAAGMAIRQGRRFTGQDGRQGSPVVIVSESTARRLWPGRSPLGQNLQIHWSDYAEIPREVVGVAADVRDFRLEDQLPTVYVPLSQRPPLYPSWSGMRSRLTFLVRASGSPSAVAAAVRRVIREADPTLAARVAVMDDVVSGLDDRSVEN